MPRVHKIIAGLVALIALTPLVFVLQPKAAGVEKRIALVIGNASYQVGALTTPANDAGLIAQTLQAAGFDVSGARDLDQDSLRRAFRDFLEKATSSGPDTVAFIYVSGYGLQLEGENYIVPIDAKIARDADVAAEAVRISDYTRPLAALKLKAGIVVLDTARAHPFARSGPPLAGGLALVEPEPNLLVAFNAAPGTVAPEGQGPFGAYAQALTEMIRDGGMPLAAVFDRTRLRVNDVTKGAEVPWHASKVEASLVFFERAADAPPRAVSTEQAATIRSRPIRELGTQEAYAAALDRDTLEGYSDFVAAYPDDPMAKRVRAIIAARREALTWRRTCAVNTPPAYWSYLQRYPQGPHAPDAHRRLAFLAAAFEPPPSFTMLAYDLPPPPPEELVYIRRPVLMFDDPAFAFAPPPPPPVIFLAPPPPEFVVLAPPPPPVGLFVLPMPVYRPVPVWVRPPAYVAPPPNNVIYNNVHNTVVINNVSNTVTITRPSGQVQTIAPTAAPPPPAASSVSGAPAPAPTPAALGPALPPSVARKAATLQSQTPPGQSVPGGAPPPVGKQVPPQPGLPLPGMQGRPLPPTTGTAVAPATPPAATSPPATSPGTRTGAKPNASPATKQATPSPPPASTAAPATPKPGATPPAPATPSTATTPTAPTPAGRAKRDTPPPHAAAAKLAPPNATAPQPPSAAKSPPPPLTPSVAPNPPASPPAVGAATSPPPPTPPTSAKPPSPPPAAARPTPPSSPPPVAMRPAPPPPSPPPTAARPALPPAPTAAAARPAPPPPAPKVAQPQPKGCPPGKSMAVVNGQPVCR